ncbi:NIPSNAP family protein [Luteimonas aquatica]|uniref:NIPSNAP family protein n=1 Tax=Luteimonas aquatica TaxID=450364 RepID=UPI001F58C8AA|nr:NIPSNAP family protein [Luteimonas aquatica]
MSDRLLEIRTYRLKPGTAAGFHAAMHGEAVPMLRQAGTDVVAYGRSDHEEETYFLIRAYADRAALEAEQARFYAAPAWRQGPREALVSRIETYLNTLLWASPQAIDSLRAANQGGGD